MSTEEVVLKKVPAITVASVREVIPTYEDMGKHYEEIFAFLGQHGVNPAGPPLTLYHDKEHRERDIDAESAVPVAGSVPSGERVKVRALPAVEQMASAIHKGSYDMLGEAWNKMLAWIEAHGYHMSGPVREVYIKGPGVLSKPSDYVTELQLPVEKP